MHQVQAHMQSSRFACFEYVIGGWLPRARTVMISCFGFTLEAGYGTYK